MGLLFMLFGKVNSFKRAFEFWVLARESKQSFYAGKLLAFKEKLKHNLHLTICKKRPEKSIYGRMMESCSEF